MAEQLPAFLSHDDNKAVATATIITASSANATYPASNMKLLPITKVWRSVAAVLSSVTLLFDLGSAMTITAAGLVNANLTSAATLLLEAGTTSAVSDFSVTLSYVRLYDWIRWLSPSQSYRYWRFTLTDAANGDNYLEVGYPILGNATVLTSAQAYGWHQITEYFNQSPRSEFGVRNTAQMWDRMRFSFDLRNKAAAEVTTFRTIYTTAKMDVTPLLFIPDTSTPTHDGFFGVFTRPFDRVKNFRDDVSMEFVTESSGKKVVA